MRNIRSISDVLKNDPQFGNISSRIKEEEVVERFYEIFPKFEKVAEPQKNENGVLILKVENAVWRSELKFRSKALIEKINNFFNAERVKQIKFII